MSIELQFPLELLGGGAVPLEHGFEEPLASGPVLWLPSNRAHVVLRPSSFLGLGVTLFHFAGVGLFCFLGVSLILGVFVQEGLAARQSGPFGETPLGELPVIQVLGEISDLGMQRDCGGSLTSTSSLGLMGLF